MFHVEQLTLLYLHCLQDGSWTGCLSSEENANLEGENKFDFGAAEKVPNRGFFIGSMCTVWYWGALCLI
jgi:hypothetical protein